MTLLVDIQRRSLTPDAYPVIGESCPVTVEAAGDEDIPSGDLVVSLRFGPILLDTVALVDFAGTLRLSLTNDLFAYAGRRFLLFSYTHSMPSGQANSASNKAAPKQRETVSQRIRF